MTQKEQKAKIINQFLDWLESETDIELMVAEFRTIYRDPKLNRYQLIGKFVGLGESTIKQILNS